jgi:hypothetical protein
MSARRRPPKRPAPPTDLGAVSFSVRLKTKPVEGEVEAPSSEAVGLIAELAATHARAWTGSWMVSFGEVPIRLEVPRDLELLEEFWVLLLELVDSDHGEWSLYDGSRDLTMEAQVFGPDVNFEFTSEGGRPRWLKADLPQRATVRLRAVVAEGTAMVRQIASEACRIDPALKESDQLAGLLADIEALQEAVADLPATFRDRSAG